MKIIQHINGVVVDIINARQDTTAENIAVVESIPAFEPREGYNGILMYGDSGLYWAYEAVPASDEISDTEALNIIMGVVPDDQG
jgi:hypothetical protein